MVLPDRKSHKLERALLQFKEDLNELLLNHEVISAKILDTTLKLLNSNDGQEKIELTHELEDMNYEMDNDILLNIENVFETIGGFEIDLIDIEKYFPCIKDEQDLLKDFELSAKNLIKTVSVTENTLLQNEKENLEFLIDSYKKLIAKTHQSLREIHNTLDTEHQKFKKIENI